MEGKLIKTDGTYILSVNEYKDEVFAIADNNKAHELNKHKLSLKNCEAIENGYDLDELLDGLLINRGEHSSRVRNPLYGEERQLAKDLVQKAIEILGDKKFSEEDMNNAIEMCIKLMNDKGSEFREHKQTVLQSLQQTEWLVEIEMICPHPSDTYRCGMEYGCDADDCNHPNKVPYLDAYGCLILKRK